MALKIDGSVICWKRNDNKQCEIPIEKNYDIIQIIGGSTHSMALKNDGTIICWGRNDNKQCEIPIELNNNFKLPYLEYLIK